ncbi:phosphoesterase-domain-containing protein [Aureobasidium pullulans]|nr:phosphoesterase-domain-containing protein [Aureobasidium pullulans]
MHWEYTNTLDDCIQLCDSTTGCVAVSRSGKACYLKNRINARSQDNSVNSARLFVSNSTDAARTPYISCPSWNQTFYNDTVTGTSWKVECDMDHRAADLSQTYTNSLEQCAKNCDLAPGCVAAVYRGGPCYLKRSVGKAINAPGNLGVRLVSKPNPNLYVAGDAASVAAASTVARTNHKTSKLPGKAFDRFVTIWLENTDYAAAQGDPSLAWLAKRGISLNNYFGVTHPSQPNYLAATCGDHFGLADDNFHQVPNNVSSIVDLLEARDISWGEYQEHMPYTGYEGFSWVNQNNRANDYVRKHNPAVLMNSVTENLDRLANIKNFDQFRVDLEANTLPSWLFITPNMTNDGHDTSVTTAGRWAKDFLMPLLNDTRFMQNTLVLVTFDESHNYAIQNRVFSILLGDSIATELQGTEDNNFYNHYSELSTVEANWGLDTLGRWDVGANVFEFVGNKTGDTIRAWSDAQSFTGSVHLANSYPGYFNAAYRPLPAPAVTLVQNGRKVWSSIQDLWKGQNPPTYYTNTVEVYDGSRPPSW